MLLFYILKEHKWPIITYNPIRHLRAMRCKKSNNCNHCSKKYGKIYGQAKISRSYMIYPIKRIINVFFELWIVNSMHKVRKGSVYAVIFCSLFIDANVVNVMLTAKLTKRKKHWKSRYAVSTMDSWNSVYVAKCETSS